LTFDLDANNDGNAVELSRDVIRRLLDGESLSSVLSSPEVKDLAIRFQGQANVGITRGALDTVIGINGKASLINGVARFSGAATWQQFDNTFLGKTLQAEAGIGVTGFYRTTQDWKLTANLSAMKLDGSIAGQGSVVFRPKQMTVVATVQNVARMAN